MKYKGKGYAMQLDSRSSAWRSMNELVDRRRSSMEEMNPVWRCLNNQAPWSILKWLDSWKCCRAIVYTRDCQATNDWWASHHTMWVPWTKDSTENTRRTRLLRDDPSSSKTSSLLVSQLPFKHSRAAGMIFANPSRSPWTEQWITWNLLFRSWFPIRW